MRVKFCKHCGKHEVKARGLCNACYLRWQRYGDCEYRKKRKTRLEKIRSMAIEELASFFDAIADDAYESREENKCNYPIGYQAWLNWLEETDES